MNCFFCEKEILEGEGKIYPLDRPYVNLRVHRVCSNIITKEWLLENYQKIIDYAGEPPAKTKTKRK